MDLRGCSSWALRPTPGGARAGSGTSGNWACGRVLCRGGALAQPLVEAPQCQGVTLPQNTGDPPDTSAPEDLSREDLGREIGRMRSHISRIPCRLGSSRNRSRTASPLVGPALAVPPSPSAAPVALSPARSAFSQLGVFPLGARRIGLPGPPVAFAGRSGCKPDASRGVTARTGA